MIAVEAEIDKLLSSKVIHRSLWRLRKKRGIGERDVSSGEELLQYWTEHKEQIGEQIREGRYKPRPAQKILIPKPGKKEKRVIEIPCMIDRMLQYAVNIVVDPFYEAAFSKHSYAFRKGYGVWTALEECHNYMNSGFDYIVDLDIQSFFDTVRHNLMFEILEQDVKDTALLQLIKGFIQTKVIYGRHIYQKYIGLSQGSSLSPLLANRFLHSYDCKMEQMGLRYIRYADDIVLFCSSFKEAEDILNMVQEYFIKNLCLQLNMDKSGIVRPEQLQFLGYGFQRQEDGRYVFALNDKIRDKMLNRMRRNMQGMAPNMERWWDGIGFFNRGWINYYRNVETGMMDFLEQAEMVQDMLIRERMEDGIGQKKDAYLDALCKSRQFVLLTDLYQYYEECLYE